MIIFSLFIGYFEIQCINTNSGLLILLHSSYNLFTEIISEIEDMNLILTIFLNLNCLLNHQLILNLKDEKKLLLS